MNEILNWVALGLNVQTAVLVVVSLNAVRVVRIEKQVAQLMDHIAKCPHTKKHPLSIATALLLSFIAACLLSGCVQTRFTSGTVSMSRTALLTRIEVPDITVATNGTVSASLRSNPKTELLESFLKFLSTSVPP